MTRTDTFWAALKESFLEMVFGSIQLDAMRREKAAREECERVAQRQMAEAREAFRAK
jgi:hypothetical protein